MLEASRAKLRALFSSELTSLRAPSPVCTRLMALLVLSRAVWSPTIWARCCSEITRPAGLSAPRLIFRPVESRSRDVERAFDVRLRFNWADRDETLLAMVRLMAAVLLDLGDLGSDGT